jgi:hypothetical protein
MGNVSSYVVFAGLLTALTVPGQGAAASVDCERPDTPVMPTMTDDTDPKVIHKAYREVRAFQLANSRYRECLDRHGADDGSNDQALRLYNASVEKERRLARELNTILQALKQKS